MFDDDYFEKLPGDPVIAAQQICKDVLRLREELQNTGHPTASCYDDFLTALSLFQALAEAYNLSLDFPYLAQDKNDNIGKIVNFFVTAEVKLAAGVAQISAERFKTRFATKFGKIFLYEFSEGISIEYKS